MRILSPLDKKKYLHHLRYQMESWFAFGQTRFTGVVLGNFFYVTHHAGYEWKRRITNEKSRAIGFVTQHGDGCEVRAICLWGYLDPVSLICGYLLALGLLKIKGVNYPMDHILAAVTSVVAGVISAVQCWFTERGQESFDELLSLLRDPEPLWEK